MNFQRKTIQVFILCGMLLSIYCAAYAQKRRAHAPVKPAEVVLPISNEGSSQVQVRLSDGSSIPVDEAWESEQGIWYQRGAMSHLLTRDRVKSIERGSTSKPKPLPPVAKVVVNSGGEDNSKKATPVQEQPVWIYLIGGARVEADSAVESDVGVWYVRGSLTIFVERARIDHIERETLETVAESDSSFKKERGWTTGNQRIDGFIKQSGAKFGVDPYLIFCVMEQESRFNPRALSPKGARGLMQLMPGTSARLGVRRPSDPAQNIAGGTRYLKLLLEQFNGRIDLVLASYNAGEGAVMKFGRKVPPYRETREYVKRISYRYRRVKPVAPAKGEIAVIAGAGM
ncbi:MAG: lytic transglycosylase domain-containing protein [Acidobacteriota bacterium]|nr:lytic transglycosylase domain-containing protein [Acidobacteriota bacterium]